MGLVPKNRLQELKRLRREAKAAKKRGVDTRAKQVRFLIVCEGTTTEPEYFKAIVKNRQSDVCTVDVHGEGRATCALVRRAEQLKEQLERTRQLTYDRVWVVFDRDDFDDFHEAVMLCRKYGFKAAWSNEAFELWFYLHFQYLESAVSRADYIEKLTREIRACSHNDDYVYKKGDRDNYHLMVSYGDESFAKKSAARLRKLHEGKTDFNVHIPCTYVDLLVEELENPESVLADR